MIFNGVSWNGATPRLRLQCDTAAEPEYNSVDPAGFDLAFRCPEPLARVCLGHRQSEQVADGQTRMTLVPCVQRPRPGDRRCARCAIAEAVIARDLHHAHVRSTDTIEPAMLAHLNQPNVLYLAGFRDGSIKVGTSRQDRTETRLYEQGAWVAIVCAVFADGISVRQAEDAATERLGLTQSVAVGRKLRGLAHPVADSDLVGALTERSVEVSRLCSSLRLDDRDQAGPVPRHWRARHADDPRWSEPLVQYPSPIDRGAHELVVVDLLGRIALVERTDQRGQLDRFALDLHNLYGAVVDWGHFGSEPLAIQDSLF